MDKPKTVLFEKDGSSIKMEITSPESTIEGKGQIHLFAFSGQFDCKVSSSVTSVLKKYAENIFTPCLVIFDLTKVDYLDSHGLGASVGFKKLLHSKGDNEISVICSDPGKIRRMLEMCGLDKIFYLVTSLEDAKQYFPTLGKQ